MSTESMSLAAVREINFGFPVVRDRTRIGLRFLRFVVIAFMSIGIVAPVVRLNENFWLKIELILLPLVAAVYLVLLLAGFARPLRLNKMFAVALAFTVCVCISLLYGTQVLGHPLLTRDLLELPKPWIPVLFFTLALEADLTEESIRTLLIALLPTAFIICIYAYGQWFNMGFTYYLQPFYSGGLHDDGGLAHYRRVYSTLSNPNTLGIVMTWLIAAFAMASLFRVGSRFWNIVLLFACLITLAMTGSRYGLLDTTVALLLIFALPWPEEWSRRRRWAVLMFALPLLLGVILWVSATNSATLERFAMLGNPLQENSLRLRLDSLWRDAFDYFLSSPVVGHGPARAIFGDIFTDSEYLQILKQYGLLGLLPYLCYFVVPLLMIRSGLKYVRKSSSRLHDRWPATYWAVCLGFIMAITALIMNIGMGSYYDQSLVAFLWMWLGIAASSAKRMTDLLGNSKLSYRMLAGLHG